MKRSEKGLSKIVTFRPQISNSALNIDYSN